VIPLKSVHIFFAALSLSGFIYHFTMNIINPLLLQRKVLKIIPHVVDTALLLSGFTLVYQYHWLSREHDWLIVKMFALLTYIGLGVLAMRSQTRLRWVALLGSLLCYAFIIGVAVTKAAFIIS